MATTNEAIKILNNCNFNSTLNAYYLGEIHNHKDSPQDLERVIGAIKFADKLDKHFKECAKSMGKNKGLLDDLQQSTLSDAEELKNTK